ncbi:cytochrome P450 4C1 [Spodoptera frugiperda]|uniref:Cytochrome P450 4C1 n=1 Tax=Spodoptera frugiperda TaxID=7108 RepID=A0A9R0DVE4_SPOFR|nr:cytochrome P450 4C1 [Spodoptera frugiperda]
MIFVVLVVLLCALLVLWNKMKPRGPSPPVYPGALPLIGHAHQCYGDSKQSNSFYRPLYLPLLNQNYTLLQFLGGLATNIRLVLNLAKCRILYTYKILHFEVLQYFIKICIISDFWEILKNLSHFSLENGGVVEIWMGPHIMYMITDPDDSMIVATKCMEKPYFYEFATEMFKNGLITASSTTWKTHRRLLNPSFNQQVMTSFLPEFNTQARNLVVSLQSEVGKEPFDIHQYLIKQLLKTVCQTSLGLATEDKTIDVEYANATEDLFATLAERFTRIYLHLSYTYAWSSLKTKQDQLLKITREVMNKIIYRRKEELKTNNKTQNGTSAKDVKFQPLLNQLLELADTQDAFTDDEIREHVDTVVAAAYDTTATTITFVLIMLGTYPEVQNRVYKEIQSVLGNEDTDLTKDNLPKLVYLDAVLKETLRLYPPSPCVARRIDSDVKLKNYTLRTGGTCILSIYGMSRHAMWGADADQFKPERWLDPSALPSNPNVFCTFSLGKRNCIGRVYAMLAIKTMLVHVLRKYIVFGDVNSVTTQFTISFKPATASQLRLELRS